MPYLNVKVIKQQVSQEQKKMLIDGLMDIVVNTLNRNPDLTVITYDEIDQSNWFIGGKPVEEEIDRKCICVEIKISKNTSSPEQMTDVITIGKELVKKVLGSSDVTNYFIINELNPDSWGFDGISMTIRNKMEEQK